ncbi:hypothetical protein C0989_011928, partial [Termitomyces sp. Mn162]
RTRTFLTSLGYPDTSATPEVWADRLLDFHERYLQGNLPENTQGTLGLDENLRNKLRALPKPPPLRRSPGSRPLLPRATRGTRRDTKRSPIFRSPPAGRTQRGLQHLEESQPRGGAVRPTRRPHPGPLRPAPGQLGAQRLPNLGSTRHPRNPLPTTVPTRRRRQPDPLLYRRAGQPRRRTPPAQRAPTRPTPPFRPPRPS